jgi:hypothetical protein
MKALIPLLLVATSALAVTTVQFAQRASAERERADAALVASQKSEARIRELERAQGVLQQQLMEAQQPPQANTSQTSATRAADGAAAAARPPGPVQYALTARSEAANGGAPINFRSWSPTQQSPAAQRFWNWQRRAMVRRQYGDVAGALGLSQEQADKLIDVLANQQPRFMSQLPRPASDLKKQFEADVAAVIGQDKLPQWQEYQKTLPERGRVSMVAEQMRQMDVPLTDDQRRQLTDIAIEQSMLNPRPTPQDGLPREELIKASMKWEEDFDKAFLDRAKSVLSKDQYERYRDYQAWQSEMRANSLRYLQSAPMNVQGVHDGAAIISSSSQTFVATGEPTK